MPNPPPYSFIFLHFPPFPPICCRLIQCLGPVTHAQASGPAVGGARQGYACIALRLTFWGRGDAERDARHATDFSANPPPPPALHPTSHCLETGFIDLETPPGESPHPTPTLFRGAQMFRGCQCWGLHLGAPHDIWGRTVCCAVRILPPKSGPQVRAPGKNYMFSLRKSLWVGEWVGSGWAWPQPRPPKPRSHSPAVMHVTPELEVPGSNPAWDISILGARASVTPPAGRDAARDRGYTLELGDRPGTLPVLLLN